METWDKNKKVQPGETPATNILFYVCYSLLWLNFYFKQKHFIIKLKIRDEVYPQGCVELAFCGLHAVHAHGVEAEHGVKLGTMTN